MPNTARLGYVAAPLGSTYDDPTVGLATLSGTVATGSVSTLSVNDTSLFPQTLRFNILLGTRDVTTGIYTNREVFKVSVLNSTTLTVISRSDNTRSHAIGDSLNQVWTDDDALNNPGPLTTTGSMSYLASSGAMAELLAPANGVYDVTWLSGVPSWTAAGAAVTPGTPVHAVQFNNSGAFGGSPTFLFDSSLVLNNDPSFSYWFEGGLVTPATMSSVGISTALAATGSSAAPLVTFAETSSGIVANPSGAVFSATNTSAAALSGGIIAFNASANLVAGTVDTVRGVSVNNEIDTGTTTTFGIFGAEINLLIVGGTHPLAVGLQIDEVTGAVLNYAVRTEGATPSLFGGTVTAADFLWTGTKAANLVYAGPASGSPAVPGPRLLVAADIPTLNQNTSGSAAKWTSARNLAGNSVDGSANVAFANKFIVQGTVDAGLSAAQFLGALGTGLVKNTTTTGVFSIAVAGDIPDLSATYSVVAGNSSLVTVGTVTSGTWSATTIAVNKGGTGATSAGITAFNNITGYSAAGATGTTSTNIVFSTSPTLVTPTLGAALATSINGNTFTTGTYTLTGQAGKTLTFNGSITLTGTDAQTYTFPSTSATVARTDAANTFTGHQTIEGVTSTGATGTGKFVFDGSPTLTTPALGTPSAIVLTNATGLPEGGLSLTDITTANVSATAHGFAPKYPNNTTTFLRGDGTYAAPAGGVTTTSPLSGTTALSLLVNVDFAFTAKQTITPANNTAALTLSANTTGVGTIQTASTVVTGTGTSFTSQVRAGDTITPSGQSARTVSVVWSDTVLVLTTNASANASGLAYTIAPLGASINPNGSFAYSPFSLGAGNQSERYGQGATAAGAQATAIGNLAVASATDSTAIGRGATASQSNTVAIGSGASAATSGNGIAIGQSASAIGGISIGSSAATNDSGNATSIAIGFSATCSAKQSIVIGRAGTQTAITADGQLVIGSDATSGARLTDAWIGGGRISGTPVGFTLHGTGGSGSNIVGSDVRVAGGISTGTAAGGNVGFQTSPTIQTSGSTANTLIDREIYSAPGKTVTSGVATSLVDIALPTLTMAGGTLEYTIICTDGTDMQALSGVVVWSAVNKGGSYTTAIEEPSGGILTPSDTTGAKSVSAGTLTLSWAMTSGTNKVTVQATATSSLTATAFQMWYVIRNHSKQAITPL